MRTPAVDDATIDRAVRSVRARRIFSRVVAGVDGSESSLEAVRQATRLVAPDGRLELFTAVYLPGAVAGHWTALDIAVALENEAGEAMRRAIEIAGPSVEPRLVSGPPLVSFLNELESTDATLVAVGTHGRSRLAEIAIGGVAGELLHNALCAVLVARAPASEALFPRMLVAGSDGSPEAAAAVDAARHLAERFDAPLRVVTATGGKSHSVDLERAREHHLVETIDDNPVHALVQASAGADLLVVGSRGLRGLQALGSVSERVAHDASCSVLVVRGTSA